MQEVWNYVFPAKIFSSWQGRARHKCKLCEITKRINRLTSRTVCDLVEWHSPCWKFPQVPRGVPKLANLMAEMDCPAAHLKCTFVLWISVSPAFSTCCQFLISGWNSDTSAQTLETDLFAREIFEESPPSSSKTTNRFLLGCNHDFGTWYLHTTVWTILLTQ